jgi:hypothetical protein
MRRDATALGGTPINKGAPPSAVNLRNLRRFIAEIAAVEGPIRI